MRQPTLTGYKSIMRRILRDAAILSVLSAFLAGAGVQSAAQTYRAADIEAEEAHAETLIAQLIEEQRERNAPDAKPLSFDAQLGKIAHLRSDSMAHGSPFSHEDAEGNFIAADKVHEVFGPYGAVGENIFMEMSSSHAFDPDAFARRAVRGWMQSEGHRANILSPRYDRAGVGVVFNGTIAYATQVFWGPPDPPVRVPAPARRR